MNHFFDFSSRTFCCEILSLLSAYKPFNIASIGARAATFFKFEFGMLRDATNFTGSIVADAVAPAFVFKAATVEFSFSRMVAPLAFFFCQDWPKVVNLPTHLHHALQPQ